MNVNFVKLNGMLKFLGLQYVWWPRLDGDLEEVRRCQSAQRPPSKYLVPPWEWPEKLWSRLHIDHASPVLGKTLLIIVDAHSKWIDVHIVPSTSSAETIEKLCFTFATHGVPQTIVFDNGPTFTSSEFQELCCVMGLNTCALHCIIHH